MRRAGGRRRARSIPYPRLNCLPQPPASFSHFTLLLVRCRLQAENKICVFVGWVRGGKERAKWRLLVPAFFALLSSGTACGMVTPLSVPVPRGTSPASAPATRVSAPLPLASYARDASGRLHFPGTEFLRTFRKPVLPVDLTKGQDSFVDKDDDSGSSIDPILQALRSKDFRIHKDIHFVSYRNNLNKIMETPYNYRDPWRIHLRRSRGTVYMDVVKLPEHSTQSEADRSRFTYWGYKFEQLCTGSSDQGCDAGNRVNANEEFCYVFKIKIGESRIVLAAEMDCAMAPASVGGADGKESEKREFVELKTSRLIEHPRQQHSFERYKLLKFWIQSFLGGVGHICCGFRDDEGQVLELQMLKTLDIPRMVRGKDKMWDPKTCLGFTEALLQAVRDGTEEGKSYHLDYAPPFTHVTLHPLEA